MRYETSLLLEATSFPTLKIAWESVSSNNGVPGVDQVSIRKWARHWEARLMKLSDDVRSNRYRPKSLRKIKIPKKDRRQYRQLAIPSIDDRVLQRAVLEVLYPIFEPKFLDCSFGYRPGLGLHNAVTRILILRENGYRQVLDADIDDFFGSVDHDILMQFMREDLPDESLHQLLWRWLEQGAKRASPHVGMPIGSPLSPLLANAYLHRLDTKLISRHFQLVRYADDFLSFSHTPEQLVELNECTEEALHSLRLCYEPRKTQLTSFEEGFNFIGVDFERNTYSYSWENKRIEVDGDEVDWLFSRYGPDYE